MVIDEDKCNGGASSSSNSLIINNVKENGVLIANGSSTGSVIGVDGSGTASLRTYKRRRCIRPCSSSPATTTNDKIVKDIVDLSLPKSSSKQVCDTKIKCHSLLNGSDDSSYQHWRTVLETICETVSANEGRNGGVEDSIRDVLNGAHTSNGHRAKGIVDHHNGHSHLHKNLMVNGFSPIAEGLSAVTSNGSSNDSSHPTVSSLCQSALSKLWTSGKFVSLCKLFSENFPGLEVEKLLDFSHINMRMKEGVYEKTPMLFSSDIQQIWKRINSIGNEMVSLSSNLSELSKAICHELGGSVEPDPSSDRKREMSARDYSFQIKQDPDASASCTCRQCGERSDGRDRLVCDSCEAMFHVSCIEPAVEEIPCKSWFCADCSSSGIGSSHEDCVVCERLNTCSGIHGEVDVEPTFEEILEEYEESTDGFLETGPQVFKGSKRVPCKACGSILNEGEQFQICEHRFCQFKYYHIRCLTSKQLKVHGPHWYCPSCLCRVCLTDKDDDDIVMCDGCDHGYHIYCMNPPRTSIPKGKWFCPKCDAGIKAIRKAKKLYEHLEKKRKMREFMIQDGSSKKVKLNFEDGRSGGMDMLLNAARTLNGEEPDGQDGKS